jgi:hypothetical protein
MTIYDKQNLFCDDQDFGAESTGSNVYSTNNLQVSPGDFGQGENILLDVIVTEAFTNIVSLQVALVTDSVLPIDDSSIVLYETPVVLLADLVVGYKFAMKSIPPGCLKHIALKFVLAGGTNPDAGKIYAGLTPDTQDSDPSF